jgi:RNA polymerase-binding transcription factor DksA
VSKPTPKPTKKPTPKPTKKPTPKPASNPAPKSTKKPTPKPAPKPTPKPAPKKPAPPKPSKSPSGLKKPSRPPKPTTPPKKPQPKAKTPPKKTPTPKPAPPPKTATTPTQKKTAKTKKNATAKNNTDKPTTHTEEAPPITIPPVRVRPVINYTLDDLREYLRQRKGIKIANRYVPGDERKRTGRKTDRKNPSKTKPTPKGTAKKARQIHAASIEDLLGYDPFNQANSKHNDTQIPKKWRKYHRLLLELRDKLQNGLTLHTEEALKKSGKEESGDLSGYSQHMADAGTDSFDRDFALNLVSGEQEALAEINEAIERMKNGTYGICEITGKPIPADRLTAVPFTRYTLEGQRELERNRRLHRRGGTLGNPMTELDEGVSFSGTSSASEDHEEL